MLITLPGNAKGKSAEMISPAMHMPKISASCINIFIEAYDTLLE